MVKVWQTARNAKGYFAATGGCSFSKKTETIED
jgi:hypothetical protein